MISSCFNKADITAEGYGAGGIAGPLNNSCNIYGCFNTGTITNGNGIVASMMNRHALYGNANMGRIINGHGIGNTSYNSM